MNESIPNDVLLSIKLIAFDFDGVFTDNTVFVLENGYESVRCWRSDGLGLARVSSVGIETLIVSTEKNPVVSARAKKLNIQCIQGVDKKNEVLLKFCAERNIPLHEVAFVGNDINDISAFQVVGLPIAVSDSHPEALEHALYRTHAKGGRGAVREVCDLFFAAHLAKLK